MDRRARAICSRSELALFVIPSRQTEAQAMDCVLSIARASGWRRIGRKQYESERQSKLKKSSCYLVKIGVP
jgi:hypothetical protein